MSRLSFWLKHPLAADHAAEHVAFVLNDAIMNILETVREGQGDDVRDGFSFKHTELSVLLDGTRAVRCC